MATPLIQGASSAYINAQNALRSKCALPEVYVYVEGLDDVAFWKECLRPYSTKYRFKVAQLRKPDGLYAEGKRHLIDCIGVESLVSGMMDKVAGSSNEEELLNFYTSFSLAMSELFLVHLVSIDHCDGKYTMKDFKKDVDALTFDKRSMKLDERSKSYISQRLLEMQDYTQLKYQDIEGFRQKLCELGFDESKYFLLIQGHIVENILVKKHLPGKILEVRKEIYTEISNCGNEMQADKRIKQFERITGIISTNASNQPKSGKTLLKEINTRLEPLIFDCTDVRKAAEGYTLLSKSLEQAFGKPLY